MRTARDADKLYAGVLYRRAETQPGGETAGVKDPADALKLAENYR
jgi:hypothetical protein